MPASPETQRARQLILKYGSNAACYQAINPQLTKWFRTDELGLVSYLNYHGVQVIAAEPITPVPFLKETITQFQSTHHNPCYFGASASFIKILAQLGPSTALPIGTQPCWKLANWNPTVQAIPSLREQFRRARAKGVTIRELSTQEAQHHPDLPQVLQKWLNDRRFPPLHFMVEFQTLDFLEDRRTFIAEYQGQIIAWLNLCPVPTQNGWLTEQFPRLASAPNGTMELLIHTAAQTLAAEGFDYFTMGLVPLSAATINCQMPAWLSLATTWSRAHGHRFYNFTGLENFKTKFRPHTWETLYAAVPQPNFTPRHLVAIARAFTQDPIIPTLSKGAIKSLRQELRWLRTARR